MAPITKAAPKTTTPIKTTAPVEAAPKPAPAAPSKPAPPVEFDTVKKPKVALNKSVLKKAAPPLADPRYAKELEAARKAAQAGIKVVQKSIADSAQIIQNATIQSKVSTDFNMPSASGKISAAQWADPVQLVGNLTQTPAAGKTAQSQAACSAANLLGAAFLSGGPDAAAGVVKSVAGNASNKLSADERKELGEIGKKISDKTATFEDLNRAQQLMYRSANTYATASDLVDQAMSGTRLNDGEKADLEDKMKFYDHSPAQTQAINRLLTKAFGTPTDISTITDLEKGGKWAIPENRRSTDASGLTDAELAKFGKDAVGSKASTLPKLEANLDKVTASLKPGESVTIRLAGSDAEGTTNDHYVTIGRQKNGNLYIYNPDPSAGDRALVAAGKKPDEAFQNELMKYEMRMNPDVIGAGGHRKEVHPDALKTKW